MEAVFGDTDGAVETRREDASTQGAFVDVHDLRLAERRFGAAGEKLRRDEACAFRRRREDARMHLHAGRDAEHGHALADGVVDVACRAVAAGEEDQIDLSLRELASGRARVGGSRLSTVCRDRQHLCLEAVAGSGVGPHHTRGHDQRHPRSVSLEARKRPLRPPRRNRLGSQLARAG